MPNELSIWIFPQEAFYLDNCWQAVFCLHFVQEQVASETPMPNIQLPRGNWQADEYRHVHFSPWWESGKLRQVYFCRRGGWVRCPYETHHTIYDLCTWQPAPGLFFCWAQLGSVLVKFIGWSRFATQFAASGTTIMIEKLYNSAPHDADSRDKARMCQRANMLDNRRSLWCFFRAFTFWVFALVQLCKFCNVGLHQFYPLCPPNGWSPSLLLFAGLPSKEW